MIKPTTLKAAIVLFAATIFIQTGFTQTKISERWNATDVLIWDRKIDRDAAIDSIEYYIPLAVKEFKTHGIPTTKRNAWAFPMSGWTSVTYRDKGQDYKDEKFDYFQGGESKGHPAHDIFIVDKDNDGIEDSVGTKIYATSMVNGLVIGVHSVWKVGDFYRSGNYVKVFDPESEALFYYSHLDSVFVVPGQIVKAGDPVGYVGRTGRKAINGRTHVHIAYYKIDDGEPIPEDIINDLYDAEKRHLKK